MGTEQSNQNPTISPRLDNLRPKTAGDPDLELACQRLEQIELFLEAMSELAAAADPEARKAAADKAGKLREQLRSPLG